MGDKQNSQNKWETSEEPAEQIEPRDDRNFDKPIPIPKVSFDAIFDTSKTTKKKNLDQPATEIKQLDSLEIFINESEKYPESADENLTVSIPKIQKQTETAITEKTSTPQNFADILDTLRTEEDSFYFVVRNGKKPTEEKIILESVETPIGADNKGRISFDIETIKTIFAVARKDWSGILLESQRNNSIFVNEQAVETTKRLRNEDKISFASPLRSAILTLHEPSLLVALEPMLTNNSAAGSLASNNLTETDKNKISKTETIAPKAPLFERNFFGYFSLTEIVTMLISTLIGAVLFFLLFEFIFS